MLVLGFLVTPVSSGASSPPLPGAEPGRGAAVVVRIARLPAELLLAPVRALFAPPREFAGQRIARVAGWSRLGFPLHDRGAGVFLEVEGRARFGRVEIVFDDGELARLELAGAGACGGGLYHLAWFGRDRGVAVVRLEARAESPEAGVRILLARE